MSYMIDACQHVVVCRLLVLRASTDCLAVPLVSAHSDNRYARPISPPLLCCTRRRGGHATQRSPKVLMSHLVAPNAYISRRKPVTCDGEWMNEYTSINCSRSKTFGHVRNWVYAMSACSYELWLAMSLTDSPIRRPSGHTTLQGRATSPSPSPLPSSSILIGV